MTCVLPGIFAIIDEKSGVFWLTESRVTLTPVRLQVRLDAVGEPLRVGLLVVDDVDALRLELAA